MTQPQPVEPTSWTWEQVLTTIFGANPPARSDIGLPTWFRLESHETTFHRPSIPPPRSFALWRPLRFVNGRAREWQYVQIRLAFYDRQGEESPNNLAARFHRESNAVVNQLPDNHPDFQPATVSRAGAILNHVDTWTQNQRARVDAIIREIGDDQSGFRGTAAEVFVNLLRNISVNLQDLHSDLHTPGSWARMLERNADAMRTFAGGFQEIWRDYVANHSGHFPNIVVRDTAQGLIAGAQSYVAEPGTNAGTPWIITVPFTGAEPLTVNLADPNFINQIEERAKEVWLSGLRVRLDNEVVPLVVALARSFNSTSNWFRLGVDPPPPIPLMSAPDLDGLGGPDLDDLGGGGGLGDAALDDLGGGGGLGDAALDDLGGGGGLGDTAFDDLGGGGGGGLGLDGGGGLGLDGLDGEGGGLNLDSFGGGGSGLDGLGGAGGGGLNLDGLGGAGGGGLNLDGLGGEGGFGLDGPGGAGGGGLNLDGIGDLGGAGAVGDADPLSPLTGLPPVFVPGQGGGVLGPITGTGGTGGTGSGTGGRPATLDDDGIGLNFPIDDADIPGRGVGTGTVLDGVSIGQLGPSASGVTPVEPAWTPDGLDDVRAGQTAAGPLGAAAAAPGMYGQGYPFIPPMGGMGGMGGNGSSSDKERERKTWLAEDEETWGTDPQTVPAVIGRGPVPTGDDAQRPAGDTTPAGTPARPTRSRSVRSTTNRPQ